MKAGLPHAASNLGAANYPDERRGSGEERRGKEEQAEKRKKRGRSAKTAWTAVPPKRPRRLPSEEKKLTGE
jgi:hypothetical protein